MNVLPIVHNYGDDAISAERHCFMLAAGGWAAKVKRSEGIGWQVIITGYRGFPTGVDYGSDQRSSARRSA